jgi:hypothetical protein
MKSSMYAERFAIAVQSRGLRWFVAFCALLFACSFSAFAQDATIVGTVTDPSGSVLPNVTITITNTETGVARTLASNNVGEYVAPGLHIGHYTIKAEAQGFATAQRNDLVLNVGDRVRVNFAMKVGSTQEHITVEANAIKVQSDSGEVSSVITGSQLSQLGTNGRSFYSLAKLVPGASSMQVDFQNPTPMGGDSNISFNGQRTMHSLYMIDGGEANDRGGAQGSIVIPSQDALAEFRVMTSNYGAEYGLSSGTTITTVLKSGTKTLHASAWWFGRNDFLNARPFFTPRPLPMPELRFNLWGFNVGGPVEFKHTDNPKTFFFYNMEWRRLIQPGRIFNQPVPLTSTYGGDLTDAVNLGSRISGALHVPCASQISAAEQAKLTGAGLTLSTCDSTGAVTTASPFPGNTIPTAALDANAQALLAGGIFPAPTGSDVFSGATPAPTSVKEEIVRVDHTFNDKFSIFGHWISEQITQVDVPTRWSGANVPTSQDTFGNPSYQAVIHATHIISPTLLNEIAFNYDGNRINMVPSGIYKLSDAPSFQQNKLFGFPHSVLPIINLNGNTGAEFNNNWNPWINKADNYQIRDDVSWTKGAHQLKFGGSWANFRKAQPLQTTPEGNFNFNGSFTGYDFADFLLGLAQGYSESALEDTRHWNSVSWALYAQDNWRATHRLTLNLGLRWDGIPHTAEINGQMANFYFNLWNPANAAVFANSSGTVLCSPANANDPTTLCNGAVSPALATGPNPALNGLLFYTNGLGVPGQTPGVTNGLVDNHWNNFGPRIGFAYDLLGNGKTIVRGGFGTFFERIQGNDMYQSAGNENLFNANVSLNNVSLADPHVGIDPAGNVITAAGLPVTVNNQTALDPKRYKNPTSYQYSTGIQQQLGNQSVLSVAYVGNEGHFESFSQESNLPAFADVPGIISGAVPYRTDLPYRGYRSILVAQNGENSYYNSLQVELHSQFRGLQLQAAYTYARAVDATQANGDGGDLDTITNPYAGWRYDLGPAAINRRNVAFVNFIYDLPIFRNSTGFKKGFLGGWQVSGIVTMESGLPLNPTVSGGGICGTIANCQVRPDQIGSIRYPKTATTQSDGKQTIQWFDPAAFAPSILAGTTQAGFGNAGHNSIWGPGRDNWDLAMFKTFAPTERLHIELRGESFNTWNHTQFNGINTAIEGGPDTGKANSAYDPRVFQLGAKISF